MRARKRRKPLLMGSCPTTGGGWLRREEVQALEVAEQRSDVITEARLREQVWV